MINAVNENEVVINVLAEDEVVVDDHLSNGNEIVVDDHDVN